MEELKQIKDLIAEEREKKMHVVKERKKQRRGRQKPYAGANKRSKDRRALNDSSRVTPEQMLAEYKKECERLRNKVNSLTVTREEYRVYYSSLTLALTIIITWGFMALS